MMVSSSTANSVAAGAGTAADTLAAARPTSPHKHAITESTNNNTAAAAATTEGVSSSNNSSGSPIRLLRRAMMWSGGGGSSNNNHAHAHRRTLSCRSSSVTATSVTEEDESSCFLSASASQSPLTTSHNKTFIRLSNSRDFLPSEIEVIYGDVAAVMQQQQQQQEEEEEEARSEVNEPAYTTTASTSTSSHSCVFLQPPPSSSSPRQVLWSDNNNNNNSDDTEEDDARPVVPRALQHLEQALADVAAHCWDEALQQVEQGLQHTTATSDNDLYWKLLTVQAEVLGRRGDYAASLETYQRVLDHANNLTTTTTTTSSQQRGSSNTAASRSPELVSSMSSLYYACGRLAVYLKQYTAALDYYTQELVHTRAILISGRRQCVRKNHHHHHYCNTNNESTTTSSSSSSSTSLAVARIYHDLARVCKMGLGDWERALGYYEQALQVELAEWQRAKQALLLFQSNSQAVLEQQEDLTESSTSIATSTTTDAAAAANTLLLQQQKRLEEDLQEATSQIQETKMSMGRINFGLGRIDEAMRLSRGRFSIM